MSAKRMAKLQELEESQGVSRERIIQLQAQEKGLFARITSGQATTAVTRLHFEKYLRDCNQDALTLLKNKEFHQAAQIFHCCLNLLNTDYGRENHILAFLTYNNIAHSYNLQGNVQLSILNLIKALEFVLSIHGLEQVVINSTQDERIPIVETYINIANAYNFQGKISSAIEYAEGAISMSQRLIDILSVRMSMPMEEDEKHAIEKFYLSQINLHIHAYQIKGQLLEKGKQFQKAIEAYSLAKNVVEAQYGHQDKLYVELSNQINGAKLRTKYLQHSTMPSNLPTQVIKEPQAPPVYTMMANNSGVFQKEIEMMKPVSQQRQRRIKRLKSAYSKNKRMVVTKIVGFDNASSASKDYENPYQESGSSRQNKQSSTLTSFNKNDVTIPMRKIKGRKGSARPSSAKRVFETAPQIEYSPDQQSLIEQIKQMRQLQQEQQSMLNQLIQQNQQMQSASMSQNNFAQYSGAQMPAGYQMIPPFPQGIPLPQGHHFPPPPFQGTVTVGLPPPPFNPYFNPYLHHQGYPPQHLLHSMNGFKPSSFPPPPFPLPSHSHPAPQQQQQHHQPSPVKLPQQFMRQRQAPLTDSEPQVSDSFNNESINIPIPNVGGMNSNVSPKKDSPKAIKEHKKRPVEVVKAPKLPEKEAGQQLQQQNMQGFGIFKKVQKEEGPKDVMSGFVKDRMTEMRAAQIILRFIKRWRAKQAYKQLKKEKKVFQKFHQKSYQFQKKGVKGGYIPCLFSAHIELAQGVNKKFPHLKYPLSITIMIHDANTHEEVYQIKHLLYVFGFEKYQHPHKEDVCIRFKSLLNIIHVTGEAAIDFSASSFEKAYQMTKGHIPDKKLVGKIIDQIQYDKKSQKEESHQEIYEEIEDNYLNDSDEKESPKKVAQSKPSPAPPTTQTTPALAPATQNQEQSKPKLERLPPVQQQIKAAKPQVQLKTITLAEVMREKNMLNKAALIVQKWYNRWVCMKQLKLIRNKQTIKQQFIKEWYEMEDKKTHKKLDYNLRVQIELAKNVDKKYPNLKFPSKVIFEIIDPRKPARTNVVFSIAHGLHIFGFQKDQIKYKEHVCVRVRSLINTIHPVGIPSQDFSQQSFEKAVKLAFPNDMHADIRNMMEDDLRKDLVQKQKSEVKNQKHDDSQNSFVEEDIADDYDEPVKDNKQSSPILKSGFQDDSHLKESFKEKSFEEESVDDVYEEDSFGPKSENKTPKKEDQSLTESKSPKKDEISYHSSSQLNNSKVDANANIKSVQNQIAKGQAVIRGFLARKQLKYEIGSDFKLLNRTIRKFNDGSTYHVFLKGKDLKHVKLSNLEDILYQVTVRNVEKKNVMYDFHISIMLARELFKTKTSTIKEIDESLIIFDRNREGFQALLECINISPEKEIVIDYKKFNQIGGHSQKDYYNLPQHQIVEMNDENEENDSEIASEAQEEDEAETKEVVEKKDTVKSQSPIKKQATQKKSKAQEKRERAIKLITKVQALIRGYLKRKDLALTEKGDNFRARPFDQSQSLYILEKAVVPVGPFYFQVFIFADQNQDHIKFTVKDFTTKAVVISLKAVYLDNIDDAEASIQDLAGLVLTVLQEQGPGIIFDEASESIHPDWCIRLNELLEEKL